MQVNLLLIMNILKCFVNENNKILSNYYLILDEYMRFLYKNKRDWNSSNYILYNDIQDVLTMVLNLEIEIIF